MEGQDSITCPEGRDPALFVRPKQRKVGEIAVMLATPENIRTLQRKLYQKAKQEPEVPITAGWTTRAHAL